VNRDFVEMLSALGAARVEFLVVGAHALAAHGVPRATGDLDIWVRADASNAARVLEALRVFGAPLFDLTLDDLTGDDTVFQIGLPPSRIDILTGVSGVTFAEAWPGRIEIEIGDLKVPVIGRAEFVRNKRSTGRPRDLADIAMLDEAAKGGQEES
jgi:hypothetical protein